jgi:hypothetical protein
MDYVSEEAILEGSPLVPPATADTTWISEEQPSCTLLRFLTLKIMSKIKWFLKAIKPVENQYNIHGLRISKTHRLSCSS